MGKKDSYDLLTEMFGLTDNEYLRPMSCDIEDIVKKHYYMSDVNTTVDARARYLLREVVSIKDCILKKDTFISKNLQPLYKSTLYLIIIDFISEFGSTSPERILNYIVEQANECPKAIIEIEGTDLVTKAFVNKIYKYHFGSNSFSEHFLLEAHSKEYWWKIKHALRYFDKCCDFLRRKWKIKKFDDVIRIISRAAAIDKLSAKPLNTGIPAADAIPVLNVINSSSQLFEKDSQDKFLDIMEVVVKGKVIDDTLDLWHEVNKLADNVERFKDDTLIDMAHRAAIDNNQSSRLKRALLNGYLNANNSNETIESMAALLPDVTAQELGFTNDLDKAFYVFYMDIDKLAHGRGGE